MDLVIKFVLGPLVGYLLGAIPFGLLIGLSRGVDIRRHGSGNIGSTNAGRVLGQPWGYCCFVLDVLKALVPTCAMAAWLHTRAAGTAAVGLADQAALLLTGGACVAGHVFPVYLKFRGGKGVATSLGMLLGVWPWLTVTGALAFGVWAVVWFVWRYVSLASITAALAFPVLLAGVIWIKADWSFGQLWLLEVFSVVMALLVVVKHRSNIVRLLNGTENGGRTPKPAPVSR